MSEENKVTNTEKQADTFKFFKCCSATLKRFSLLAFAINIFFIVILAAVAFVLIAVYLGTNMLTLLALPIVTVIIILVLVARLISAFIYGFAEIVEKYEKQ